MELPNCIGFQEATLGKADLLSIVLVSCVMQNSYASLLLRQRQQPTATVPAHPHGIADASLAGLPAPEQRLHTDVRPIVVVANC